ncbi:MAG: polyphosphate kinase 2, partial [Acidiferrobacterales bacterium]
MKNANGTKNRKTAMPVEFDIDNPELSPKIAEKAITSGGYPYSEKLKAKAYKKELLALQLELLKLQEHIQAS